jgi:sugar phosphate isomerase/epimerase
VRVVLEFLPIFTIATLGDALGVVQEVASPSGGVLVDTLHLARSGGGPADLADVPAELLPYLQLADAPDRLDDPTPARLREEALHGRLLPGQGRLPLDQTLATVPDVPVSVELRSQALMQAFPDPTERARAVLAATRRLLES